MLRDGAVPPIGIDGRSTERYSSNVWLIISCYVLYLLFCVFSFQNPLISQPENAGLTISDILSAVPLILAAARDLLHLLHGARQRRNHFELS